MQMALFLSGGPQLRCSTLQQRSKVMLLFRGLMMFVEEEATAFANCCRRRHVLRPLYEGKLTWQTQGQQLRKARV